MVYIKRYEGDNCIVLPWFFRYHDKTFTTNGSPTKRSLTNGSRQMAHDEWLGLGVRIGVRFRVRIRG